VGSPHPPEQIQYFQEKSFMVQNIFIKKHQPPLWTDAEILGPSPVPILIIFSSKFKSPRILEALRIRFSK